MNQRIQVHGNRIYHTIFSTTSLEQYKALNLYFKRLE